MYGTVQWKPTYKKNNLRKTPPLFGTFVFGDSTLPPPSLSYFQASIARFFDFGFYKILLQIRDSANRRRFIQFSIIHHTIELFYELFPAIIFRGLHSVFFV